MMDYNSPDFSMPLLLKTFISIQIKFKYLILPWSIRKSLGQDKLNTDGNLCTDFWNKVTTTLKHEQKKLCINVTLVLRLKLVHSVPTFCQKAMLFFSSTDTKFVIYELHSNVINLIQYIWTKIWWCSIYMSLPFKLFKIRNI